MTDSTIAAQVFYNGVGYVVHRVTYDKEDRKRVATICKRALEDAPKDFDGEIILGGQCTARYFVENSNIGDMLSLKVLLCPDASYLAWRGGTILANVATVQAVSFMRSEYEAVGPAGVKIRLIS